jgi:hypothetical protein
MGNRGDWSGSSADDLALASPVVGEPLLGWAEVMVWVQLPMGAVPAPGGTTGCFQQVASHPMYRSLFLTIIASREESIVRPVVLGA